METRAKLVNADVKVSINKTHGLDIVHPQRAQVGGSIKSDFLDLNTYGSLVFG